MKGTVKGTNDPDFLSSEAALRRAAKAALRLGLETDTPVWVVKRGKTIDLTKEYTLCNGEPQRRSAGKNGRSPK